MFEDPLIRYNHPEDANTWFVQQKEDDVPSWAVNIEDYDPADLEPKLGPLRCDECRYAKLKDYGYSSYTVEGTTFSCELGVNPHGSFDRWYGEDKRLAHANLCDRFVKGRPYHLSVEGEEL